MPSNAIAAVPYPWLSDKRMFVSSAEAGPTNKAPSPRIALYSHDTLGLGHFRRNLRIAKALQSAYPRASHLLISGTRLSHEFELPPGADVLTLPALHKARDGSYRARNLNTSLEGLTALRAQTIRGALLAYRPDVLIVDNVPRGAQNELDDVLPELRRRLGTRCVLGLRDIIDSPRAARREWLKKRCEHTIQQNYDAVWIYADPTVYDLTKEYQLAPATRAMMRFTGYQDARAQNQSVRLADSSAYPIPGNRRLALCLLGGGQDGAQLAETFMHSELPEDTSGLLLTGPDFPQTLGRELKRLAADSPHLDILDFTNTPQALVEQADKVVTMGGYNTVFELLSHGKHPLIVPRVEPRQEQLIRAERLQQLGIADMLHPDHLDTARLGAWLAEPAKRPSPARQLIDLHGLERLPHLLTALLDPPLDHVIPLTIGQTS